MKTTTINLTEDECRTLSDALKEAEYRLNNQRKPASANNVLALRKKVDCAWSELLRDKS